MKLIKKLLLLVACFWLLQPEASAQNTTRLLIGEWYFVNEEKDKVDLNNVLTFSLEGVYTYRIAGLQGVGYWELSKNKQYLLIRDFRYTHLPQSPPERFEIAIEYIDDTQLVLSRRIKKKKIKTKYRKL
jgi:hypothetical protein